MSSPVSTWVWHVHQSINSRFALELALVVVVSSLQSSTELPAGCRFLLVLCVSFAGLTAEVSPFLVQPTVVFLLLLSKLRVSLQHKRRTSRHVVLGNLNFHVAIVNYTFLVQCVIW